MVWPQLKSNQWLNSNAGHSHVVAENYKIMGEI